MKIFNKLILFLAIPLVWSSCKVDKSRIVTETTKDINGTWKIIDVKQNGVDLTGSNGLDLSQFSISFQNNAYTLVNPLPFIVYTSGTFSLNDPQVPTLITFTATGGKPVISTFDYPIVSGTRNIRLTFSANPGCTDNTYIYTLQKSN